MENNNAAQFNITSHAHVTIDGLFVGAEKPVKEVLSVYQNDEVLTPHLLAEMVSDEVLHTVTYGVDEVWTSSEVVYSLTWCEGHCSTVVAENS